MANDFTANPWFVDTVMPLAYNAEVLVQDYIWSEPAAQGDRVIAKDVNGKVVIDLRADVANTSVKGIRLGWIRGFQVTQIDSGKLILAI